MLRIPARKRPASRSLYDSPFLSWAIITSSARSRGVSSIRRTTGSISGRNLTISALRWASSARKGVIDMSWDHGPSSAPKPMAEAICRKRRRRCP